MHPFGESLLKRSIASLLMLFSLVTIVFFLLRIVPGDPMLQYYSPKLGTQLAEKVKVQFGLDQPVHIQYAKWMENLLQGDLGFSISFRKPVIDVISDALPVTLSISLLALFFQIILGVSIGTIAGVKANTQIDRIISTSALIIYCAPAFLIAILLIYLGSVIAGIFPTSHLYSIGYEDFSTLDKVLDRVHHLFLPVLTLTITSTAFSTRFVRDSLVSTLNQPFITSLRSTGIGEKKLILNHVLPNSLLPMVTIIGIEISSLLSRALITEIIFSLPGIGRLSVNAIFSRDYPLIIGCTIISGMMVIIGNFIADVLQSKFDPRVSYESIG